MPSARIATATTVALLLALTGCGHGSTPRTVAVPEAAAASVPVPPAVTTSPAPSAPASKAARPKVPARRTSPAAPAGGLDQFVAAVQRKLPAVALDRRDDEVGDLGRQACQTLGRGRSATDAAGVVAAQGVAPADARTLVGLAQDDLCRS